MRPKEIKNINIWWNWIKKNRLKALGYFVFLILMVLVLAPFIKGYFGEKGKQIATSPQPEKTHISELKGDVHNIVTESSKIEATTKGNNSPNVINSPNTVIDNSVTINKSLPEIRIGTITDMSIRGASPYEYSFLLRYSTTMDSPAKYQVDFIDLELHEVIGRDDGADESVFLKSIRLEESFKSFGMLRKAAPLKINFSSDRRIRDVMLKLVMGVEGGLTRNDTRTIWRFGGG